MTFTIAGKEILNSLKTVRFVVTMLVCCLLLPMSVWVLSTDYLHEAEDYQDRVNLEIRREEGKNYQMNVNQPVPQLSPLFRGVTAEAANTIELKHMIGWNRPSASAVQAITNDIFPTVDLTFIIGLVMSAMALIFSYDAVSGEKAEATLRLIMSNPLPRYKLVMGKWLGLTSVLILPLLAGLGISLFIFFTITGITLDANNWFALILTFIISVLYLSLFVLVGIAVSTFTRIPAVSIVVCLGVWGLVTIIMPQTAVALSAALEEVPSPQKIEREIRIVYNEYALGMQKSNYEILDEAIARGDSWAVFRPKTRRNQLTRSLDNRRIANNIEREYWMQIQAQERLGQNLSLLSPYGSYNLAMIGLAGTGPEGQRQFLLQAYRYGEKYFKEVWNKSMSDDEKYDDWGKIFASQPPFRYQDISFESRLESVTLPVLSLTIYLLVMFMITVIAFNRYDVR